MANVGLAPASQHPARPTEGNGMAVAGLVLGMTAIVLCWIVFLNWVVAVLGIIFSALGIGRGDKVGRGKGMAIVGMICAVLAAGVGTYVVIAAFRSMSEYLQKTGREYSEMYRLDHRLKTYAGEHGDFPKGTAGPSPAADCCTQPNDICTNSASDWQAPVWLDIGFVVVGRQTYYHYSYESHDGKTFVARAISDRDCDGEKAVYELRGSIGASGEPTTQVIAPKPGVY
jgi:hypothetical protein